MDRKIIAALQVSLDGLIEGPEAGVDWIDNWDDPFEVLPEIDTCIVGGGMYPGYEQYWRSILADPTGVQALTGRPPSEEEVAYARFADRTPHVVLSRTLDAVSWKPARIARLVDEIRLTVHPLVLGQGKPLFNDVRDRHALDLVDSRRHSSGRVTLIYRE